MHTLAELNEVLPQRRQSQRMPMLFVGHGSPMVTLSEDGFAKAWRSIGRSLPVPVAVLCVSAHWMTRWQTHVLAVEQPETIHDFGGFPQALFDIQYPAPRAPALAAETASLLADFAAYESHEWGARSWHLVGGAAFVSRCQYSGLPGVGGYGDAFRASAGFGRDALELARARCADCG